MAEEIYASARLEVFDIMTIEFTNHHLIALITASDEVIAGTTPNIGILDGCEIVQLNDGRLGIREDHYGAGFMGDGDRMDVFQFEDAATVGCGPLRHPTHVHHPVSI